MVFCSTNWTEKGPVPQEGFSRIHEDVVGSPERFDASYGSSFFPGFRDGVLDQNTLVNEERFERGSRWGLVCSINSLRLSALALALEISRSFAPGK